MKALQLRFLILTLAVSTQASAQSSYQPDLPILTGLDLGANLSLFLNTGSLAPVGVDIVNGSLQFTYPGGKCGPPQCANTQDNYGFALFSANNQTQDLSAYQAMVLRMSGDAGSSVEVAVQDSSQPPGTETTVLLAVSPQLQTYYIPLSWFLGANLKNLSFPAEVIFKGSQVQKLNILSIAYTATPPAAGRLLPHLVFGSGWSTSLLFTNTSGANVSFPISFFGLDGTALDVPVAGNASMTVGINVLLAPGATSVVEIPNTGNLTSGYVNALLPPDVNAFGILQQTVQGQPDQEIPVSLSGTAASSATVTFDESKFITSVAVVNPSESDANIQISARDSGGNTLGSAALFLPARSKQLLVLRNLQGLTAIAGQQGSVAFVASSGNLALLALGFNSAGTLLTAIPVGMQ